MGSDRGKLFIGGISWETTEQKLRDYFQTYGQVAEAIIMKDRATGRARGFGFIVFHDPVTADRVLQEKHTIDGRMVEAKRAVPRDEQLLNVRSINGSPANPSRTKKIFVGGLPSSLTETDFKKYFEGFGTITDVVVMYDHNTQRPRGFGFITFDSENAVENVLQKTFHELNGKMVEVKRAIPKELSPSPARSNDAFIGVIFGRGVGYGSGYMENLKSRPVIGYGARPVGRYSPAIKDNCPSYGPDGYAGSAVYNGHYNGNVYGSNNDSYGAGNTCVCGPETGRFGGSLGGFNNESVGNGRYANTPPPGRNLWVSQESSYSINNSSEYRNHASVSTLGIWDSSQSPGSPAAYDNSYHGSSYSGFGSSPGGYAVPSTNYSSSVEGYGARSGNNIGMHRDMYRSSTLTSTNWGSISSDRSATAIFAMDDIRTIDDASIFYRRESASRRQQYRENSH